MEKVKSLIAALGRDQGSMRKVKMNRLTAEWQVRCDVIYAASALEATA